MRPQLTLATSQSLLRQRILPDFERYKEEYRARKGLNRFFVSEYSRTEEIYDEVACGNEVSIASSSANTPGHISGQVAAQALELSQSLLRQRILPD